MQALRRCVLWLSAGEQGGFGSLDGLIDFFRSRAQQPAVNLREGREAARVGIERGVAQNGVNQCAESRTRRAAGGLRDGMDGYIHCEILGRFAGFGGGEDVELFDLRGSANLVALLSATRDRRPGLEILLVASRIRRENFFPPESEIGRRRRGSACADPTRPQSACLAAANADPV